MVVFVHWLKAAMDVLERVGGTEAFETDITSHRQEVDSIASRKCTFDVV